ncbi:MAG: intradiol ring-cleavage dioxygenase, partial [Burkholderiales bacterium]|nr:intradiol ring-cleavage dioxygenase [Burkholderiales bacterium]
GETGRIDADFQGYGRTSADAQGRYAFRTIRPVPYGGRPAHLHFKLAHPRASALTTQLYLRGESAERNFAGMFARERDRLEIAPAPAAAEAGALDANYDFVLAPART